MDDHILGMSKPSHRDKFLSEGLNVMHRHGFAGASVRDIVKAAGVPQGSFTNHFASKEAFGLEVIGLYLARAREMMGATLLNEELAPLARLEAYLDSAIGRCDADGMKSGCLFGNFAAEVAGQSETLRAPLAAAFIEVEQAISVCLRAGISQGVLPAGLNVPEVAGFILSGLQGAILLAKATGSIAPVARFKRILFETVLSARH